MNNSNSAVLNSDRHRAYAPTSSISIVPDQQEIAADASEAVAMRGMILRASRDPSVNVDKFERMTALYERVEARTAEREFNDALTKAQTGMRPVAYDSSNSHTHSRYASYLALDRAMRPIYSMHGFALSFNTAEGAPEGSIRVVCDVSHSGGHSRRYQVDMPADGKGAKAGDVMTKTHAAGSALTYGQRYLLKMIFNIAVGDDDDGNAASPSNTGELIDAQQVAKIEARIKEVGANKELFLAHIKLDNLNCIYKNKFAAVMAVLDQKAAAKNRG